MTANTTAIRPQVSLNVIFIMEKNETQAYFGVFKFGDDPSVVSKIMGVKPTKAWIKGDHYSKKHPSATRTHSRWMLESGCGKHESVETHIDALLKMLENLTEQVKKNNKYLFARIGVAQYFYEVNPQFILKPKIGGHHTHLN
ncbi:MAG: DUF4279 domain-containing protein [Candidatus Scalindua sp.]|nr:DUF4279 domain-containing protein [Candidatus Scalindua sp.]